MKRILPLTLLLLIAFAQAQVTPRYFSDPLEARIATGPFIEERIIDDDLIRTRHYDANGLLVKERGARATEYRYVGTAVIKSLDTSAGAITFTGLIPEEMKVRIIRSANTSRLYDHQRSGSVDPEDRSRFIGLTKDLPQALEVGETVHVGVLQPYTTTYTYEPNRVVQERTWDDGTLFETTTYHYGRHGLTHIRQTDHQTDSTRTVARFEYDENGNLTKDNSLTGSTRNSETTYTYQYDDQGRLTRIQGDSPYDEVLITYAQTTPTSTTIKFTTERTATTITYDQTTNTIEFTSTDHTGLSPDFSSEIDHVLSSLGIQLLEPNGNYNVTYFSHGRLTLDDQKRIIEQSAYTPELFNGSIPSVHWEITTQYDDQQNLKTTTANGTQLKSDGTPDPDKPTLSQVTKHVSRPPTD